MLKLTSLLGLCQLRKLASEEEQSFAARLPCALHIEETRSSSPYKYGFFVQPARYRPNIGDVYGCQYADVKASGNTACSVYRVILDDHEPHEAFESTMGLL